MYAICVSCEIRTGSTELRQFPECDAGQSAINSLGFFFCKLVSDFEGGT